MAIVIINVPNRGLPDFLRSPEVSRFLDEGRVSIQPDQQQPVGSPSTRQKGREMFEGRASERGLKVRTPPQPGVGDFIIDGQAGSRLVRLVCSESPRISLRKEWAEPAKLILAYVWALPTRTRIFLMGYQEVEQFLGDKALNSPSFKNRKYYTTAVPPRRQQVMEHFEDRWDVFNS